ncbi:MAG: Uma2 family endonuclease [Planctomycetaceae bacterium]|nr:Uma2 family endonuclease [Planctomycetaceae bacterium]
MTDDPLMTAKQFLDARYDLPESGQWAELESGKVTILQPPDLDHGNTVLNLSKAFAEFIQKSELGYACFDLGMLMESTPDTIRFPAACYYLTGPRFAETDKPFTPKVPELVIELASTADRRGIISKRVEDYLAWGVAAVWAIDPQRLEVAVISRDTQAVTLGKSEILVHQSLLPEFSCPVEKLFEEPSWWAG